MKPMFRKLLSMLLTVCFTATLLPMTVLAVGEPPVLQSAVVTSDGYYVELTFDKAMAAPESDAAGFTVVRSDSVSRTVTAAQLKAGDDTKITLTLETTIKGGEVFRLNYIPGTVAAADTGALAAIESFNITNDLPHPTLNTNNPPAGTVGESYTHTFTATGGTVPYAFYLELGSPPAGLTLDNATGVLSGTPTQSGNFSIGIMVVDQIPAVDLYSFTVDIFAAPANVCEIGGTPYVTLDLALDAVPAGGATATTIKLLQDIDYAGGITVANKKITFDLDGKTLSIDNTAGTGLTVTNGSIIDITNPGAFNVTGSATGLSASNSTVKVTNASSNTLHGVNASNNSDITVTNDVTSASHMAVAASGGSMISIGGNVSGANYGVYAQDAGTAITVTGNVSAAGNNSCGAHSRGGADVTIHGNVTATGSNSIGANLNTGGTLTVDGIITAQSYIMFGTVVKTAADITTPTTKPGYNTYTDDTSTIWVKAPSAPTGVCEIGGMTYATLDDALAEVGAEETGIITLLDNINYGKGISITGGRNITFGLAGYTLAIENTDVTDNEGIGLLVTNGMVDYTGSGAFNVIGVSCGVSANGGSASATVTNATATYPDSYGANASNGGSITIGGNAQGELYGAHATGSDSIVTVQGNAIGTGTSSFGAGAYQGGSVIIEGDAHGVQYGVNASGVVNSVKSSVLVLKNVTASDELNGIGALAAAGGKITIDGTITAKNYIKIYLTLMYESPASRTLPTTKEGYYTYSDGFSTVWVMEAVSNPPTIATVPLAAGEYSGYALKDGAVWAWGLNDYGQLGNNSTLESHVPVQMSGLTGVTNIAAGQYAGYAVKPDGTVWAWGGNDVGQLGNNSTANKSLVPVQVSGLTGVAAIAGGRGSGYALKSDGTVWAWGWNSHGQLGNNSTVTKSLVPVQVSGLTNVTAIAAGYSSGYALKSDGTVWAWGNNGSGQLGNNSTANSLIPVQVSGLTNVTAIASWGHSGYALKSDGTAWAWGHNNTGQLGDNSTTERYVPVQVSNLTDVTAIAGGFYSAYALKSDGTVWAWGYNSFGELGNDSTTESHVPVQVSNLSDVTAIAGGSYSAYALKSDGAVWAWGRNNRGQLGNNSTTTSHVPVQVSGLVSIPVSTPVSDFTSTGQTDVSADFSFSAPTGATAVKIQQSTDGGTTWTDSSTSTALTEASTTATVTGLEPNMTYKFKLVVTSGSYAGDSNVVDVTTAAYAAEIGGTPYATLDLALDAVDNEQTIKLLADITDNDGMVISNGKSFIIDMDGHTLNVTNSGDSAKGLEVTNSSSVGLDDSVTGGTFNVSGSAYGVYADHATVTVSEATASDGTAVVALNNADITVTGNAVGTNGGVYASNTSVVAVNGDVVSANSGTVAVNSQSSTIHVFGSVIASGGGSSHGVLGSGNITVDGDVEGNQFGVAVSGSFSVITVGGDVKARGTDDEGAGFFCYGAQTSVGDFNIGGNITAAGGTGARSTGGGEMTIAGTITAAQYIEFGFGFNNIVKSINDKEPTTTKEGYYTYTDGNGEIWVKAPSAPTGVCEIGSTQYPSFGDALTAVTSGQTIRLLKNVSHASKIEAGSKSFIIDVSGFKLTVNMSGDDCVSAINGQSVTIKDTVGGGSLEVNGSGMKNGYGINGLYADGAASAINVTVPATINVTGQSNIGVNARGKGVVDAKLTDINNSAGNGFVYGLIVYEGGTAHVGNITVAPSGNWCIGVYVYGDVPSHGQTSATVDGTISASEYIRMGAQTVNMANETLPTTKAGYRTYKLDSAANANTVWVKIPSMTDTEKVAADKAALTFDTIRGTNSAENNIIADLATLPLLGANGSAISWSSTSPSEISVTGLVTRPANGSGDKAVTLTATITCGSASDTVSFNLTVNELPPTVSATLSPATATFDKNPANQADVITAITWNDAASVTDVKKAGVSVGVAVYSISGNTLTISKVYLATEPVGLLALTIEFDKGNAATLTISISDTTAPTYTVTFDSQGGRSVSSISGVTSGSTISAPTAPTRSGYTFGGWYKESSCTNAWNFSTDTVTGNITIYAKWTANPPHNGGGGGGSYTTSPVSGTVNGSVIDGATSAKVANIKATVTTDSNGNATISMKAAQTVILKQPDGSTTPISDISKVAISSAAGTPVTISPDGTIQVTGLAKGTDNNFNITYDLGNGQKISIGTMEIKIASNGDVTLSITLIDPYGIITDAATGKALVGANVTLYYANTNRNKAAGKTPDTAVPLPGIAGFKPNDNQNPQTSDANGAYGFMVFPTTDYYIVSTKDDYNQYTSPTISVEQEIVKWDFKMNQTTSGVTRLAGLTRVDTALAIAKANYLGKIAKVILVTADNYPDALAGSVLAYKLNAPILLVGSSDADQEKVLDYMKDNMNPTGTVYILGGTAVVSSAMEAKVTARGFQNITRLGGADRYETSVKIADQLEVKTGRPIVLVYGENYPDALSISSMAAEMQYPILLVQKDGLSDAVQKKIVEIKPAKVYIIGGAGVISTAVESQVAQITSLDKTNIVRIAGEDRYETSLAVAKYFNLSGQSVCVATGNNFPDALAGSVYAANHNAPIILADGSLSDQVMNYLKTREMTGAAIFGGEAAVSKVIEQQLGQLAGK